MTNQVPGEPFGSDPSPGPPELPKQSGGGGGTHACLLGCLITFGLCAVLCAGAGFYAYQNFRTFAGDIARQTIVETLEASELPAAEKAAITQQIDRVVEAYQNNEISHEELARILQRLAESPLIGLVMVQGVESTYVIPSGLTADEKEAARRTIMRVLRGAVEKKIDDEQIQSLSEHFMTGDQQNRQLKQKLTDDELRAFLAEAKAMADAAEVPDEDYQVRVSDEIRKIVDQALGE